MRLYFFRDMPTLAASTQIEMAKRDGGYTDQSPFWTDTPKRFPEQRDRMLNAARSGADEIWIASLPVLADGRADMRHVVAELERLAAAIVEGSTGWTLRPPYEQGLAFAHAWDVYSQRRKVLDHPRDGSRSARAGGKNRRMPDAEARMIWLDPTISTDAMALEKMNSDPRYRREWAHRTAWKHFGKSGRPPGRRPNPLVTV